MLVGTLIASVGVCPSSIAVAILFHACQLFHIVAKFHNYKLHSDQSE
ncbi:hypothetical protein T06_14109 [Trichinella sp. T6]|nr:hypothetical protein T06_14109 [Trichinella sp. T6]